MCPCMKKDKLCTFTELRTPISSLWAKADTIIGTENEIRLLKYYLLFAELQYGDRVVGKSGKIQS